MAARECARAFLRRLFDTHAEGAGADEPAAEWSSVSRTSRQISTSKSRIALNPAPTARSFSSQERTGISPSALPQDLLHFEGYRSLHMIGDDARSVVTRGAA